MSTPDDPYAMVRPGSVEQKSLLQAGWLVTDSKNGWDHMELPQIDALRKLVDEAMQDPHYQVVASKPSNVLELQHGDKLIVTAPGIGQITADYLKQQVEALLKGERDTLVTNYDINIQVIRPPRL